MHRLIAKTFSISGIDDRKTFLLFSTACTLLVLAAGAVVNWAKALGTPPSMGSFSPLNWGLTLLILVLVAVSLLTTIRRLRDIGLSFWCLLLMIIPVINLVMLLALLLLPGNRPTAYSPPTAR